MRSPFAIGYSTCVLMVAVAPLLVGCDTKPMKRSPSSRVEQHKEHDFGFVRFSETKYLKHTFRTFNNNTQKDLTITSYNKSCTCTEATLSANVIKPGRYVTLMMGVRVPGSYQPIEVSSTVHTDDPANALIVHALKFTSVPDIAVEPSLLIVDHRTETEYPLSVSIFHAPDQSACQHALAFDGPKSVVFRQGAHTSRRLSDQLTHCTHDFIISVPASFVTANADQTYRCSIGADGGRRAFFDVRIPRSSSISVVPGNLDFGVTESGRVSREILIRVRKEELKSEDISVRSEGGLVRIGAPRLVGNNYHVPAELDATKLTNTFNVGRLEVLFRDAPVASIPWIAYRKASRAPTTAEHSGVGKADSGRKPSPGDRRN
jgi:hypothetical protein